MAIVTLSTRAYGGARELAQRVSAKLDYRLVSREDVIEKITQYGMSKERLDRARRIHLGILQRMDLEWIRYVVYLRAALSKEIRDGNLVYLGDNGQHLLDGFPNVLGVGVIADTEYRIGALMRRNDYAIDRRQAERLIKRMDEKRGKWGRILYNDGKHDPSEFDLVVEPRLVNIPDACEIIRAAVEMPQFQTTAESLRTIEHMTLAADLRARIAVEADVRDDNLRVEVRNGVINVSGSVHSTEDVDAIRELLGTELELEDVGGYFKPMTTESTSVHS